MEDQSTAIAASVDDLSVLAASFARYLRAANRSPKTIKTYAEAVDGLARFLTTAGMPTRVSAIRREHIESYLEDILHRWTASTALNRYQGLRQFFRFLTEDGEITESPMARMTPPKVPEVPPPVLTDDELRALLKAADGNTFEQRRDLAPGCGSGTIDPREIQGAIETALRSGRQKHVVKRVVATGILAE